MAKSGKPLKSENRTGSKPTPKINAAATPDLSIKWWLFGALIIVAGIAVAALVYSFAGSDKRPLASTSNAKSSDKRPEQELSSESQEQSKRDMISPLAQPESALQEGFEFTNCLAESGITFQHTDGSSGEYFVIEPFTAGLAVFDFDNDGLEDIYFLNGTSLPFDPNDGSQGSASKLPRNALYRNLGGWKFQDVTESAGVGDTGYGMGVVAADFDNDGDIDLYVANYGPNVFYVNNGDGTFTESASQLGVQAGSRFSTGVLFFDIENDGDLDIYCANYQKFHFNQHITRKIGPHQFHPGPADYPPDSDILFRNNGDNTFSDISAESGIGLKAATGMGVIAADFDQDGDQDVFVANDGQPNFFWVNTGDGHFIDEGLTSGLAYDRNGQANGNMGVDCRDVDGDGDLDIVSTTYEDEMPVLYQNVGDGLFVDTTHQSRIDTALRPHVHWGVGLEDFNNDGLVDLFIACGHFKDNIQHISDRTEMKVRDYLHLGIGNGKFRSVTPKPGSTIRESSRGAAFADLDNDGDLDIVVLNFNARPSVLRNDFPKTGSWLDVRLIGVASNRFGVGSLVTLSADGQQQTAAVHAGRGYQSHYGRLVHFGVSSDAREVHLDVTWPSGRVSHVDNPTLNQVLTILEPESPQ